MWRIKSVSLDSWTDACCCFCFHLNRQSEGEESGGRARLWLAATAQVFIYSSFLLLWNFWILLVKIGRTDWRRNEGTNQSQSTALPQRKSSSLEFFGSERAGQGEWQKPVGPRRLMTECFFSRLKPNRPHECCNTSFLCDVVTPQRPSETKYGDMRVSQKKFGFGENLKFSLTLKMLLWFGKRKTCVFSCQWIHFFISSFIFCNFKSVRTSTLSWTETKIWNQKFKIILRFWPQKKSVLFLL